MSDIRLPWLPGGARGGDKLSLKDRHQYLMVVRLAGSLCGGPPWMDWHVVEVENDEDGFLFQSNGWVWRWEDVEWCLPLASLELPDIPS
ncbi:MAG: hypothetical protein ACYC3X_20625 [Pirellulaceae bacterium]